jgi:plasmid segregation protein ParM
MSIFQNLDTDTIPSPIIDKSITPVAVDNGYADQKIAYWTKGKNGKQTIAAICKPSRAKRGADDYYMDEVSGGIFELNGMKWTVASNINDPDTMRDSSYATSDLNTVLVNNSLITAGFGGSPVRLATGLPFAQYWLGAQRNTELFDTISASLRNDTLSTLCGRSLPSIKEHEIYAESLAALIDFCFDEEGNNVNDINTGCAVVDIGGETTDISVVGPDARIVRSQSGTKQIGVLDVKEKLGQLIKEEFSIDKVRAEGIDLALLSESYNFYGEKHDIKHLVDEAKRVTVNRINDFIREKIGDASDLDFVVLVGGGAALLSSFFSDSKMAGIIRVPEQPQFSNARGMLKHMTFIAGN